MPETFTKDEIWEAVLQMGGEQEDLTPEEAEKSKSEFFTLLDGIAKNRKPAEAGTADAKPEEAAADGEKKEDEV
jgi:hypothetical protein